MFNTKNGVKVFRPTYFNFSLLNKLEKYLYLLDNQKFYDRQSCFYTSQQLQKSFWFFASSTAVAARAAANDRLRLGR